MDQSATGKTDAANARVGAMAMFAVLLASYAINAMDRQIFPLLLSDVRREYGFSLADGAKRTHVLVPVTLVPVRASRATLSSARFARTCPGALCAPVKAQVGG